MDTAKTEKNNIFTDWIIPIFTALIIAFFIHKFVFFNVFVPTSSMVPTININDKIFATRIHNIDNIKRGDVLIFYSDERKERLIKRVIGLPGDKIQIENGKVSVNGKEIREDYVKNNDDYSGTFSVPEGKYFFLGDNRADSADARLWANPYIDESKIQGQARYIFFPFSDAKKL